jgi:hypothetical protein
MLSQLHAAWLQIHDDVFDALPPSLAERRLGAARHGLTRIYHDTVRDDLLPRLVDHGQLRRILSGRSTVYRRAARLAAVPVEFLFGAGRFGHAMVRPRYRLNDQVLDVPLFRRDLNGPLSDLRGQPLAGTEGAVDWSHFFTAGNPIAVQSASKINAQICRPLFEFPAGPVGRSIPMETLTGAHRLGVPSGQALARILRTEPVPDGYLWHGTDYRGKPAPLWYYVLKEAEYQQHGQRLGQVGGEIVAGVLAAALAQTPPCPSALRSTVRRVREAFPGDLVALLSA